MTFEWSVGYQQLTGAIVAVFKDSKGFVWFLLDGGIGRFDGYDVKVFRSDATDTTTIGGGLPLAIAEDRRGLIWISCDIPHGLNAYDPVTSEFIRFGDDPTFKNKLPSVQILSLFVDSTNILWMCTAGEGVYSLDWETKVIRHFKHDDSNVASISDDYILGGVALPGHNILFYSREHIDLFDPKTFRFESFDKKLNSVTSLSQWKPGVFQDFLENVCLPTDEGLHIINRERDTLIHYPESLQSTLRKNIRKYVLVLPDKNIWINCDSGLFVLNPLTKKYSVYRHDYYNPESIPRSLHQELTYDNSGVIWIKGGGICKVSLENDKFHIANNPQEQSKLAGPVHENVRRCFQDKLGTILQANPWGVYQFDFLTKEFHPFPADKAARAYLNNKDIRLVFQDADDSYWFGIDNNKIVHYEPKSHSWKSWSFDENDYYSYRGDYNTQAALQDVWGNLWFVGEFSAMRYDKREMKFKSYKVDSSKRNNRINSFEVVFGTDDSNIWFGGIGLFKYNSGLDSIIPVIFNKNEAARILSTSRILSILKENALQLWIGTDGNGMFLLDLKNGDCKRISISDGLPNNRIFAISKDYRRTLWVSTDGGLCRFNPADNLFNSQDVGDFKTYDANYTWPVQGYQGPDNTMYFKMFAHPGLLYFHPDSIPNNSFFPPVYITDFRLFNKSVFFKDSTGVLDSAIEIKRKIVLSYDQNAILFKFAALSFVHPEKNQYAYMLQGFDKDWIYTDASQRFASYTNLVPGKYTFKVKASNNDGVWNSTPTTVNIVIIHAFWQHWWFSPLIVLVFCGLVFWLYRFRIKQIKREQQVRRRLASDLHDDIGSSLSSISYYSEAIRKQVKESSPQVLPLLEKMEAASDNSIDAMSDIVWTTNPTFDKGIELLNRMRAYATDVCDVRQVSLEFESDASLEHAKLGMETRRNLFLIFKEAVNNALKYSGCTRLNIRIDQGSLKIQDNGLGFDTSSDFAGNGLKNMEQRAKEIKGRLEIKSSGDSGTMVTLKF